MKFYFCRQEKDGACCLSEDSPIVCDPVRKLREEHDRLLDETNNQAGSIEKLRWELEKARVERNQVQEEARLLRKAWENARDEFEGLEVVIIK